MYELILVLPLLIIPLLAVIEFGVLISNEQPLEMATRDGALAASHLSNLPVSGQVPAEIIAVLDRALSAIGIDVANAITNGQMSIRLEHNVDPNSGDDLDPSAVLETGTLVCPDNLLPPPPDPDSFADGREYVRLSVCLRSDLLTPNLLKNYSLDMTERVTVQTKTYRYTR